MKKLKILPDLKIGRMNDLPKEFILSAKINYAYILFLLTATIKNIVTEMCWQWTNQCLYFIINKYNVITT